MAQAIRSVARRSSSAVHCVIVDSGAVQTVSSRGVVLLDIQSREVGTDGRAHYHHAAIGLMLADARELLGQLSDAIAEASAPLALRPLAGWQHRLETARSGSFPRRAAPSETAHDIVEARRPARCAP